MPVNSRHRLDHLLIERLGHGADADNRSRPERLYRLDEVLDWRVRMRVGLLEISQVISG
jgi:hypothetical protein